jgi:23S rRNA (uracil1939-C5)-methyltransferase
MILLLSQHLRGTIVAMTVTIDKIVSGGDGMGRLDGKVVFVPFALPGEVHRVRPVQEKKSFIKAESEEILEVSSKAVPRKDSFCPLYARCGGCNLQHMPYEEQLKTKVSLALESLTRLGGDEVASFFTKPPEISPSPETGYRNRAQFHRRGDCLGFHSRNSHELIPIDYCPLLSEGINNFLKEHKIGDLPSQERFTIFGTETQSWLEGCHNRIELSLMDRVFQFSPDLFFQSNLTLFPQLLEDVLNFAGEGDTFMDLYSGVGVFARFLEERFDRGTAVESSLGALKFARMNLSKTEFFEEPVEKWCRKSGGEPLDFLVVDPPRTGLSRTAREGVLAMKPAKFCYVSCDPVTQARDLKDLLSGGFRLQDYRLYDFYPQTSHMESVAFLEYSL